MPTNELTSYLLTPAAVGDLEAIWRYGAETWSPDHADSFIDKIDIALKRLVAAPEMARLRTEFNPPVRIQVVERHLIVYRISGDHLEVLRVLGGNQDWQRILSAIDV